MHRSHFIQNGISNEGNKSDNYSTLYKSSVPPHAQAMYQQQDSGIEPSKYTFINLPMPLDSEKAQASSYPPHQQDSGASFAKHNDKLRLIDEKHDQFEQLRQLQIPILTNEKSRHISNTKLGRSAATDILPIPLRNRQRASTKLNVTLGENTKSDHLARMSSDQIQ